MINKDKLSEYIAAFRRPPNPFNDRLEQIQVSLDRMSYDVNETKAILIEIAKALGVEIK
jgi:hypothetical protein